MKTITMQFEKKYDCKMIIGHGLLSDINNYLIPLLPGKEAVMITNPLVRRLYGDQLVHDLSSEGTIINVIEVPDGEKSKSLPVVEKIYDRLLELKANRFTSLITLGGGVIGDLGGFVAATFMRGIPLIHIPTTLLAQIDSSIGGKVAIDHPRAKNIIGSFYQPIAILADPETLRSLPVEHLKNGIVEALKIAIIDSSSFFNWLDQNMNMILQKNRDALAILVDRAVKLKSEIVLQDPWERKQRHYLNFGHSVGHALETIDGYDRTTHGEAVAVGMIIEASIACHKNICKEEERIKIGNIIKKLQLPFNLDSGRLDLEKCWNTILLDKKNKNGIIRFVLPERIGKVHLVQPISKEDIIYAFNTLIDRKGE